MLDFRSPMDNELSEMADERVLSLPVTELNEPLVDVRKVTNIRIGPPPEFPETAPHYTFVREGLVARLEHVQRIVNLKLLFDKMPEYRN